MSNIVKRHVGFGMLYSLLLLAGLAALYLLDFPIDDWKSIWTMHESNMPFLIAAPLFVLFSGAILGLFSGLYWRRRWHQAARELESIREGQQPLKKRSFSLSELQHTWAELERLQAYMNEQAKLAQKLTNERVIDREEEVQRIVSEERNRLARELHDSVSQELFAASMLISALTESEEGETAMFTALKQLEAMVQQSQLEMRALLLHLRPAALKGKRCRKGWICSWKICGRRCRFRLNGSWIPSLWKKVSRISYSVSCRNLYPIRCVMQKRKVFQSSFSSVTASSSCSLRMMVSASK